ncbi:MAG: glycoside hydrolase family 95 protein [Paraprevotella sp.]|nr:glycoside hydrolase family 95 protein [Paraprevotella sp.]
MRKQLLMMSALLCTALAVCAEKVTDLSQLSNDKVYFLRSERAFLLYSDKVPGKLCSNTGSAVGSVTASLTDSNQQFRIEKTGDNYYLFSEGAGQYVSSTGAYEKTASTVLKIEASGRAAYPWKLCLGSNGMNSQISGQTSEGIVVNGWTTTDAGNCYYIEEAVPAEKTYDVVVLGTDNAEAGIAYGEQQYKNGASIETTDVIKSSDVKASSVDGTMPVVTIDGLTIYVSYFAADTKFYTIQNGKGGYVSMNGDYCDGVNLKLNNTARPRDNKSLWAFVSTSAGKYQVYNYSRGLSRVLGITGDEANARATMVKADDSAYSTVFSGAITFGGTEPSYVKIDGTNKWWNKRGDYLALWNTGSVVGDEGSKFFVVEVEPADYPDEYFYEVQNITGVSSFSPKNPNTLWYKTSAAATGVSYPWMEYALPLGNGELGCMIFGGVHNEEIQFNEKTLWSGSPNVLGAGSGQRTFMDFGSVFVENRDNSIFDGVTDYVRYLDIEEGIAGVEFKNGNGSKFTRKYLSSAPSQVIAARYTAEGADKMNLRFTLEPGDDIGAGEVTYENGMAVFTGKMHVKYAARLHVVADDAATVTTTSNGILVGNATEVTFYLKGETNFNGDVDSDGYFVAETPEQVSERAKAVIDEAVAKGYEAIEAEHIQDFTAITKRMTFDLGLKTPTMDTKALVDNYYPNNANATSTANDHLFLEQLYFHYGRYLAISSNRKPIAAPNNLQGIWNDRGAGSPWNSDIHTNINIQMNYWPTEITNLSDLHKPFVNFILRGARSKGWKAVGEKYNEGYGWSVLTESSLYNSMSEWGNNYLVANVWYTSHLWTHWRYTQDKEFLKKAFPVMWDCAQFWFHRLIEDRGYDSSTQNSGYSPAYSFEPDGSYVAPNEYSAEQDAHNSEDGTAHAQQMISYLFQNLDEAISILGIENTGLTTEDVAKLNEYLEKTDKGLRTEVYTANTSRNSGWTNPRNGVNKGDLVLREWKYSPYDVSNDPGHRHISHLMALFPLDQITPESEFFGPAVNSLKLRGDAATGWSMGWKVNLWARALDGDHAHVIIKNALKHSTAYGTNAGAGGIYYNLFDSHAPFQIDGNFGVCSGVAECLLQSAHGYINVLPALPSVWNRQGDVKGMKAIGNFTVDFNWAGGKCQYVRITSHAGASLKVRCTRGAMEIDRASITVDGVEVAVSVDQNGIATIPCGKDSVVEINFGRETGIASVTGNAQQNSDASIYDLSGRRLSEIPSAQVYIQNGTKKVSK